MSKTCDVCDREIDFEGGEAYYQSETVKTMCEACYQAKTNKSSKHYGRLKGEE